jgi:hypothetical protein
MVSGLDADNLAAMGVYVVAGSRPADGVSGLGERGLKKLKELIRETIDPRLEDAPAGVVLFCRCIQAG